MAIADLGGLGAKEGQPTTYDWRMATPVPALLPWLGVLLLLGLKPNRVPQAWWIWAPLGLLGAGAWLLQSGLAELPSNSFGELVEIPLALVFGLAAVWLLAPVVRRGHRFLTFLLVLVTLSGFSVATFAVKQGPDLASGEAMGLGIATAVIAAVLSVALCLAGWLCRHRPGPLRFCAWLLAALLGVGLLVIAPIFVITGILNPGNVPMWVPFAVWGMGVGLCLATLLPLLVLSVANAFFRERLKQLVHLDSPALPPIIAVEPAVTAPVGVGA